MMKGIGLRVSLLPLAYPVPTAKGSGSLKNYTKEVNFKVVSFYPPLVAC